MQESQIHFPAWWPFCFQVKIIGTQFTWRGCKMTPKPSTYLNFYWSLKTQGGYILKEYAFTSFPGSTFPFQGPPCRMVVLSLTASDFLIGTWILIAVHVLETGRWVNCSFWRYLFSFQATLESHWMLWMVIW